MIIFTAIGVLVVGILALLIGGFILLVLWEMFVAACQAVRVILKRGDKFAFGYWYSLWKWMLQPGTTTLNGLKVPRLPWQPWSEYDDDED